eukprot:gene13739-18428_t
MRRLAAVNVSKRFTNNSIGFLFRHQQIGFATAAQYTQVGDPRKVLKLTQVDFNDATLDPNQVSLKFLVAPINPSDINMVEGVYGVKKALPAIAGNEGVAVVTKVGSSVQSLKVGDWVQPSVSGFGTWIEFAKANENDLIKIPSDIPVAYAGTISINPSTAYRLLNDFQSLKTGDVVIQNGANSMVGLAVIQMARERGIITVNIIKEKAPDTDGTLKLLTNLGGDINITDNYFNTHGFRQIMADLPPCKLALNCVGGDTATDMIRVLGHNGTLVTYGGMSKIPFEVPLDVVAHKQLKLEGFWLAKWSEVNPKSEREKMINEIADLIKQKKLSFFFELHDFDDFDYALKQSQEPYRLRKVLLNFDYPDRLKEHDERSPEDYEVFDAPVM